MEPATTATADMLYYWRFFACSFDPVLIEFELELATQKCSVLIYSGGLSDGTMDFTSRSVSLGFSWKTTSKPQARFIPNMVRPIYRPQVSTIPILAAYMHNEARLSPSHNEARLSPSLHRIPLTSYHVWVYSYSPHRLRNGRTQ